MHYVNDINIVPKMGQIIKVQRPVSSAPINGLYVILEAAFTTALLGVLLYKYTLHHSTVITIKFILTQSTSVIQTSVLSNHYLIYKR
jgi:hypothetical protein